MGPGKADLLLAIADTMNRCFKSPLVSSIAGGAQGGGAVLTEKGLMVLQQYRQLQKELEKLAASTHRCPGDCLLSCSRIFPDSSDCRAAGILSPRQFLIRKIICHDDLSYGGCRCFCNNTLLARKNSGLQRSRPDLCKSLFVAPAGPAKIENEKRMLLC